MEFDTHLFLKDYAKNKEAINLLTLIVKEQGQEIKNLKEENTQFKAFIVESRQG